MKMKTKSSKTSSLSFVEKMALLFLSIMWGMANAWIWSVAPWLVVGVDSWLLYLILGELVL